MIRNKYRNIKTVIDGFTFDSKGEAERWIELKSLESRGEIHSLNRQVTYHLLCNKQIICKYKADFTYVENGVAIVEDYKGVITPEFRIKAKLFQANFGHTIRISGNVKKKKTRKTRAAKKSLPPR